MKVIKWRTFDGQQVGSHFAQVTVRFDTKQVLINSIIFFSITFRVSL